MHRKTGGLAPPEPAGGPQHSPDPPAVFRGGEAQGSRPMGREGGRIARGRERTVTFHFCKQIADTDMIITITFSERHSLREAI